MRKTATSLYLDDKLKKHLKDKAKEKGLTLNAYVRLLLIEGSK